ncbi:MAG: hypothetical protein LBS46_05010 [Dysgonamonadaceae bacterium]|jgi:hypothetical protein|nr:hypothetical protein [Dysgonamonadaceae bacterium]
MRKTINLFTFCLLLLAFGSCSMEDLGNYNYLPEEAVLPVSVDSLIIPQESQPLLRFGKLYCDPAFGRFDSTQQYSYRWYVIENVTGRIPKRIELHSTDKNLRIEIDSLEAGSYHLYLEVRVKSTPPHDIFAKASLHIVVSDTQFNNGWYVLKDDGEQTNIDYFERSYYSQTHPSLAQSENIIRFASIPGRAVSLAYLYRYYYMNEDNVATKGQGWVIQTDQTIVGLSNTLAKYYKATFDDNFYDAPAQVRPQGVYIVPTAGDAANGIWLMNANRLYSIYGMSLNIGKFSPKNLLNGGAVDIFPEILYSDAHAFVYEANTGTFYYAPPLEGTLIQLDVSDLNYDYIPNIELIRQKQVQPVRILSTLTSANYTATAYGLALLKHKQQDKYYLAKVESRQSGSPFAFIKDLDATADILNPEITVMAATHLANVIYYAKNGNELWIYTDSDGPVADRQKKEIVYPAGETITYIRPIQRPAAGGNLSWVCILTHTADGNYNFYVYNTLGATPELDSENPAQPVLSGTGYARMVFPHFPDR